MGDEKLVSAEEARGLLEGVTPGPWQSGWDCADTGGDVPLIYSTNPGPGGHDGTVVFGMWYDGPRTACTEKNAALLAAAPDLARTVIALHKRLNTCMWCGQPVAPNAAGHTSACYETMCNTLKAERDRLARILAVERGDEAAVPEGWRKVGSGAWRLGTRWSVARLASGRWGVSPPGTLACTNVYGSALEAMEAADAAREAPHG